MYSWPWAALSLSLSLYIFPSHTSHFYLPFLNPLPAKCISSTPKALQWILTNTKGLSTPLPDRGLSGVSGLQGCEVLQWGVSSVTYQHPRCSVPSAQGWTAGSGKCSRLAINIKSVYRKNVYCILINVSNVIVAFAVVNHLQNNSFFTLKTMPLPKPYYFHVFWVSPPPCSPLLMWQDMLMV